MPPCQPSPARRASSPANQTTHPVSCRLSPRKRVVSIDANCKKKVSGPDPAQGDPMLEPRAPGICTPYVPEAKFVHNHPFWSGCPKKGWSQESAHHISLETIFVDCCAILKGCPKKDASRICTPAVTGGHLADQDLSPFSRSACSMSGRS